MHTYGNLEYTKDEIDVGGASTSSYIHPYGYRATPSSRGTWLARVKRRGVE